MIEPFVESQKRDGVISYGLSSYGYDARIADEFKLFTNIESAIIDPKAFAPHSFVDRKRRGVHHPAEQLRARPHGRIFPHPARRAGDLPGQVHLCPLRHHRERHAAGAGVGRPGDHRNLQHHAAAGEDPRQRGHLPVHLPAGQRTAARPATPTRRANTCASAASRCRGCRHMDRIRIRGGKPLSGEIPIGGAKNAALPLMAAGLLTDQRLVLSNVPRLADIETMGLLLAQHGIAVEPLDRRRPPAVARRRHRQHRGALRHRAQDARVGPGARPAAGAGGGGAGVAARRLRHRHAAGRSAPERAGADGRPHRAGGRLYRRARAGPAARRHHRVPLRLGRRHREPADGRGPGRRVAPCWPMRRASRKSATWPNAWWRWARGSRASAPTS